MEKRNRRIMGISLFAILIVLMGVSVAAAEPWAGYLTPQDSKGYYGHDSTVELEVIYNDVELTYGALAYQVDIHFNPDCVNITNADFSASPFGAHMFTPYEAGVVRILEDNYATMSPLSAGTHKLATLTLNGNCSEACTGDIWFDTNVVSDTDGNEIASTYTNGTYSCVKTSAGPTAYSVSIEDCYGPFGSYVEVPVLIEDVSGAPIQGVRLVMDYNESVLDLSEISYGEWTSEWTDMKLGEDKHALVIATGESEGAIPIGGSGSVVLLVFSVIGAPGDTSPLDLSLIELSNSEGVVGTAPGEHGTFLVVTSMGSVEGTLTHACNGTAIAGVAVTLVVDTTVTDASGIYNFMDVSPDDYVISATKSRFWDNATNVKVIAGEVATADMTLYLKGDLNNDCVAADVGDVVLMLQAAVRDIPGDARYDLNENGIIADVGDVVLMLRAAVYDLILW